MTEQIFGVYELDDTGNILYSRPYGREQALPDEVMVGRNFFDPIEGENAESLFRRFRSFVKSGQSVESFTFSSAGVKEPLTAKVMMTRGHEKQDDVSSGIFILDIRKAI